MARDGALQVVDGARGAQGGIDDAECASDAVEIYSESISREMQTGGQRNMTSRLARYGQRPGARPADTSSRPTGSGHG